MEALGIIIPLAIAAVASYACYRIAIGKGRNGPLFAVLGFLFPIVVLIVVALLPSKRSAGPDATSQTPDPAPIERPGE
jgi:hypothetical protein